MALFGAVSFQYYKGAIDENFVKQTVDEGNMLAALFGQESLTRLNILTIIQGKLIPI